MKNVVTDDIVSMVLIESYFHFQAFLISIESFCKIRTYMNSIALKQHRKPFTVQIKVNLTGGLISLKIPF